MRLERSKNAIRNVIYGFLNKILSIILPFLVRTVFIQVLGAEYLGLNSLFGSILTVLNLTELGFSSAIVYHMYEPIAQDDTRTINALLQYYKAVYQRIGLIILAVGCVLIPFLPNLIKGSIPENINLTVVYLIYLTNTSVSYFLYAYYSALISAFQRQDLISKTDMLVSAAMHGFQILCLLTVKTYYVYLAIMPAFTIFNNFRVRVIAKKVFPDFYPEGQIDKKLRRDIREKISGLVISKVCAVSRNAFDSIFLSAFLGLVDTAKYNNYYYIMNSITVVMLVVASSIKGGVGNSIVMDGVEENYQNMKRINFLYLWLSGWFSICLLCLYQPFMKLWVGEKLMFPLSTVILLCIYFYVLKMGDIRTVYVDTKGVWWEMRYRSIFESAANIILNYVLGKRFGVNGIIIASLLSLFFINFIYGSTIIFKHYFGVDKAKDFYITNLIYLITTFFAAVVTFGICSLVKIPGLLRLIVIGIICVILPNVLYYVAYHKTAIYKNTIPWVLDKTNMVVVRKNNREGA